MTFRRRQDTNEWPQRHDEALLFAVTIGAEPRLLDVARTTPLQHALIITNGARL